VGTIQQKKNRGNERKKPLKKKKGGKWQNGVHRGASVWSVEKRGKTLKTSLAGNPYELREWGGERGERAQKHLKTFVILTGQNIQKQTKHAENLRPRRAVPNMRPIVASSQNYEINCGISRRLC